MRKPAGEEGGERSPHAAPTACCPPRGRFCLGAARRQKKPPRCSASRPASRSDSPGAGQSAVDCPVSGFILRLAARQKTTCVSHCLFIQYRYWCCMNEQYSRRRHCNMDRAGPCAHSVRVSGLLKRRKHEDQPLQQVQAFQAIRRISRFRLIRLIRQGAAEMAVSGKAGRGQAWAQQGLHGRGCLPGRLVGGQHSMPDVAGGRRRFLNSRISLYNVGLC